MGKKRSGYISDVSDEEWAFCQPYLTLMKEEAPQREYSLREVFNALRWFVRAGCPWRMLPNDVAPWWVVQQQTQRWIKAGCFEAIARDLRLLLRVALERQNLSPTVGLLDSRTLQSSPESGARAGYDGAKRRKGSKVHVAVDTLGHLLALKVTSAADQDRAQVGEVIGAAQSAVDTLKRVYVDQGYTGADAAAAAAAHRVELTVVKLPQAKRGFVLLPKRWIVERSFAWAARFRRLARDYERLPSTLAGYHWLVFAGLMLAQLSKLASQSA
jgi:transposase